MVRVLVPILVVGAVVVALVLAVGTTVRASTAIDAPATVNAYLPGDTSTDALLRVPDDSVWQSRQVLVAASTGYGDLAEPTQQSLGYGNEPNAPELAGRWLQVSYVRPGQSERIQTAHYHVGTDGIDLQAIELPTSWQTFVPGLPALTAATLAGKTISWSGTDTLAVDGDQADPVPATATISTRPATGTSDCVDTTVRLTYSPTTTVTRVIGWCRGSRPGWAVDTLGGDGVVRTDRVAPQLSHGDVPAATTLRPTGTTRPVLFAQIVNDTPYEKATEPSPRHLAAAGRTLVVADAAGRVTAWQPYQPEADQTTQDQTAQDQTDQEQAGEDQAELDLAWQATPGGYVTGLATIESSGTGPVTVVGTATDRLVAYAPDGWQLWQREAADVVVAVVAAGDEMAVLDASGSLQLLDPVTGAERWHRNLAAGSSLTAGAGTLALVSDNRLTALDAATGATRWQRDFTDPPSPSWTADQLLVVADGAISALSPSRGEPLWSRRAAGFRVGAVSASGYTVRTDATSSTALAGADGSVRWRAPRAGTVTTAGDLSVLTYPDRIDLFDARGRRQSWPLPKGYPPPDRLQLTGAGVFAYQLGQDQSRWWAYR